MPESWLYYVPVAIQHESKVAFHVHLYETDGPIDSEEKVYAMLDALTKIHVPEPEKGTLPVIPLGFTLVTAKKGPGVAPRPERKPVVATATPEKKRKH